MAMTNAQKQAKHRLAVKERLQRYEAALRDIAFYPVGSLRAREIALLAMNPTDPAKS